MQENIAGQPLLSIGLIVKNEEKHLENCLKALQPLRDAIPCQLVIADTGSTDNTVEIAQKYADELFYFEWVDDFAAARNAVIDHCTGKWFLSVDADEYLQEEGAARLVDFLQTEAQNYAVARVTIRNWRNDVKDGEFYSDLLGIRMVNLATKIRYKNRIHELIPLVDPFKSMPEVVFDHYGYYYDSEEEKIAKSERNMKYMREEIKKDPNNLRLLNHAMISYIDNKEEKDEYARRALEITRKKIKNSEKLTLQDKLEMVTAYQVTALYYCEINNYEEGKKVGQEGLRVFPDHPCMVIDINYILGIIAYNEQEWEQCVLYTQGYLKAHERWLNDMPWHNTVPSLIYYEDETFYQKILTALVCAYYHLDRFEDALCTMREIKLQELTQDLLKNMLNFLVLLPVHIDVSSVLQNWYQTCMVDLKGEEGKEYFFVQFSGQVLIGLLLLAQKESGEDEERYFAFLKSLATLQGEDDILRLVRLAVQEKEGALSEEEFAQNVQEYLNSIENWEEIPAAAYAMALRAGVTVPRNALLVGFQMMSDKANWLAANQPQFVELLSRLSENWDWNSDILTLTWYVLLWTAALNIMVSVEDHAKRELIFEKYCEAEGLYLQQFFNPAVLNAEGIQAFPPIHQFGFYAVQAQKQLKNRDLVGALGTMKHVAEVNQDVKKLVQAITEVWTQREEEAKNAKEEMSQLAQSLKLGIQALVQTGREQEAKEALEKYIKICPNDTSMMEMLRQLEGKDYRLLQ